MICRRLRKNLKPTVRLRIFSGWNQIQFGAGLHLECVFEAFRCCGRAETRPESIPFSRLNPTESPFVGTELFRGEVMVLRVEAHRRFGTVMESCFVLIPHRDQGIESGVPTGTESFQPGLLR